MHACGHDVHTASLLGTARILHALKEELNGSVKLIFQASRRGCQRVELREVLPLSKYLDPWGGV